MQEPLPLASIHERVLEFLRSRGDAVIFGAQAVNAYVDEPRMTQEVDVLSTCARDLAERLRADLAEHFHIAVRVHQVAQGEGFRVFQLRSPKNRHLADVRQVTQLPENQMIAGLRILAPLELIVHKVLAYVARRGQPKSGTDWRDIMSLFLAFPQYKSADGPVLEALRAVQAPAAALEAWEQLAATLLEAGDEDAY